MLTTPLGLVKAMHHGRVQRENEVVLANLKVSSEGEDRCRIGMWSLTLCLSGSSSRGERDGSDF